MQQTDTLSPSAGLAASGPPPLAMPVLSSAPTRGSAATSAVAAAAALATTSETRGAHAPKGLGVPQVTK
eukprot:3279293-Alexandrium_andersonii.AAC.1